jgi:chorismate mutase
METDKLTSPLMTKWLSKRPLIISGPCSAETREQVLETSVQLADTGKVDIIRAGIWKPRTHPGKFEGIGTRGLPWLQDVKKSTGLPVTVEVARAKHIEDALSFDVDILWIGARSTVNPATIEEVASALRGVDIPVLIKNPMNPDIELWMGAVERIANAGIKNIGLVHRGFSTFGSMEYRNTPMWHIAIEMKRRNPELMMICDPTHISGRRDIIQSVAQKAIDLNFDGLMIESHINPDEAWTDSRQQITPSGLKALLDRIIWRKEKPDMQIYDTALEQLRDQIDQIDDELLSLLGQRMKVAEQIGEHKKLNELTILQKSRWNEILEKRKHTGKLLGLSSAFIDKYLTAVHMESISHQNKVMNL